MKIKFSCNNCYEDFNISAKYLIEKDGVICPNCSTEFPETSFSDLKDGIRKIEKCRDELPSVDSYEDSSRIFDFEIIY